MCSRLILTTVEHISATRVEYHFSRSLLRSDCRKIPSVVFTNPSKLEMKGRIPHLFLFGALASCKKQIQVLDGYGTIILMWHTVYPCYISQHFSNYQITCLHRAELQLHKFVEISLDLDKHSSE